MSQSTLLSRLTIGAVGLTCKAALNAGVVASVTVSGAQRLLDALAEETSRGSGRGIVTVCNHISVLDDPLMWGALPLRSYWDLRDMRWSLGAADIMFTNPLFSAFFRRGQVLETFRGKGIYQPAVDGAIEKLNEGGWVHLFGEGKVNQPKTYIVSSTPEGPRARLQRFKWGTARIIMEAKQLPTVIPMWITGFDAVMPEPRNFPRFLPRLGAHVSITFGEPVDHAKIVAMLGSAASPADVSFAGAPSTVTVIPYMEGGASLVEESTGYGEGEESEMKRMARCALTDLLQREVERLGYSISGPLLGRRDLSSERDRA